MGLFSPRRAPPPIPGERPTIAEIFRDDLAFIVGVLLHFRIPAVDVEDAAQEVIRAVEGSLPRFDPSRDRRSWLYGVAFNLAANRLRRARCHQALFAEDAEGADNVADTALTIEDRMIQDETHRTVREVLDEIDLDRRAVLLARIVYGMSELETAEALAIPKGTVKTRLRLAKQELRDGIERREREAKRTHRGAFLLPLGVLLANEGQLPVVPSAMRARLLEQLQSLLARPSAPVPANDGGPAPSGLPLSLLRHLGSPQVGHALASAFVGGAFVFAVGPIDPPAAPPPTPEALAALCSISGLAPPAASSAIPATIAVLPRAVSSSPPLGIALPAPRPSAPAEVLPAVFDDADPLASAALMHSAETAFERNDIRTARQLLEQHAQAFRRSKLGTSRDLLWVRVLLREGKRAEAQQRAEAIRSAMPRSPVIKTLDALFNISAESSL